MVEDYSDFYKECEIDYINPHKTLSVKYSVLLTFIINRTIASEQKWDMLTGKKLTIRQEIGSIIHREEFYLHKKYIFVLR